MNTPIVKTITSQITIYPDKNEVSAELKVLMLKAQDAMMKSYSPYSKFKVGCAIVLKNGEVFTASNQENASYGLTVCAERNALFAIGSAGKQDQVAKIGVVASAADKFGQVVASEQEELVTPCGACRQVIKEFEDLSGEKIKIFCVTNAERVYEFDGIETLLPFGFGPKNLL